MRYCGHRRSEILKFAVSICFVTVHAEVSYIGEVRNISQCFVEALLLRTEDVTNDVSLHLEQIAEANASAVASIEEAFKKRVKNFVAQYVFFFLEAEQKFHDCEDSEGGRRCNYDAARDLKIRTVPIASARMSHIVGGVSQAVRTIHKNSSAAFFDSLQSSHTFGRDLLSSTTRCIYKE